jgi:hypothetical protein
MHSLYEHLILAYSAVFGRRENSCGPKQGAEAGRVRGRGRKCLFRERFYGSGTRRGAPGWLAGSRTRAGKNMGIGAAGALVFDVQRRKNGVRAEVFPCTRRRRDRSSARSAERGAFWQPEARFEWVAASFDATSSNTTLQRCVRQRRAGSIGTAVEQQTNGRLGSPLSGCKRRGTWARSAARQPGADEMIANTFSSQAGPEARMKAVR